MSEIKKTGLELLREPFPANQINSKPQGTKAQNDCPDSEKTNCRICGGWHHPKIKHLDYVGHAALTDRLLDADPLWSWEPLAFKDGLPAFDATGGLWMRVTVCGHSRIGYGHAQASTFKEIGSREKEVIGDGLRNTCMRFGAALELWHKGDLHLPEPTEPKTPENTTPIELVNATDISAIRTALVACGRDEAKFCAHYKLASIESIPKDWVVGVLAALSKKITPENQQ